MANFRFTDNVISTGIWEFSSSAEGDSSVTHSATKSTTTYCYFRTTASIPYNADWETGAITVYLTIDTGLAGIYVSATARRLNSGGTLQQTGNTSSEAEATAGNKTLSIASFDWSAGSTGDLFEVELAFRNSTMTNTNVVISTGNSSLDYVSSSITVNSAPSAISGATNGQSLNNAGSIHGHGVLSGSVSDPVALLSGTLSSSGGGTTEYISGVSAPYAENLLKYSENLAITANWTSTEGTTCTATNTWADTTGELTLDTITTVNAFHNFKYQDGVTHLIVTAGRTYTFSFEAVRGTMTETKYSVRDESNSADIIAVTSYYSQINATTATRVSVDFTTPAGCTEVAVFVLRDSEVTGTTYIGRVQVAYKDRAYVRTTTTAVTAPTQVTGTLSLKGVLKGESRSGLKNSLISYWKLDDTSLPLVDAHGTNNFTSAEGTPSYNQTGKLSGSLLTNASGEYVYGAIAPALLPVGLSKYSIQFWIRLNSLPSTRGTAFYVMVIGASGNVNIQILTDNTIYAQIRIGGTNYGMQSATALAIDTWYHYVITIDQGTAPCKIYRNGSDDTSYSGNITNTFDPETGNAFLSYVSNQYVDGYLDEVAVWKRVLTSTEASALYNSNNGLAYDKFYNIVTGTLTAKGSLKGNVNGLRQGLVAYWKLDETSGTFYDSVGTNNGTLYGTAYYDTGKINNGLVVDGDSDYGNVPHDASLVIGTQEFSVSAWFKPDQLASTLGHPHGVLLLKKGSYAHGIYVGNSNNKFEFVVTNTAYSEFRVYATDVITAGQMYHVVGVCKFGEPLRLYIDGTDVGTSAETPTGTFYDVENGVQISGWGTDWLADGVIDEPCYYRRALTAKEVSDLYASGSGRQYPFFNPSLVTGTLVGKGTLVGVINGTSLNNAGTLTPASATEHISGATNGQSLNNIGVLVGEGILSGSTNGTSLNDAGVLVGKGTLSGVTYGTSLNNALTLTGEGILAGAIYGTSLNNAGTLTPASATEHISGATNGQSLNNIGILVGEGILAGVTYGTSLNNALTLTGEGILAGAIYGTSLNNALVLTGTGSLSGATNGQSLDNKATFSGSSALQGASNGQSLNNAGTLLAEGQLQGAIYGTSLNNALTLTAKGALAGVTNGESLNNALTLTGTGSLLGVTNGESLNNSLTLTGMGALVGVTNGESLNNKATFTGSSALQASTEGVALLSGVINGAVSISGETHGTSDLSGVLEAKGLMGGKKDWFVEQCMKYIYQNQPITGIGDAEGLLPSQTAGYFYVALYTTNPTNETQGTETTYTNYQRVPVPRSSVGWTVTGTDLLNANNIIFPTCGTTGATLTGFAVCRGATAGVDDAIIWGDFDSDVEVIPGLNPVFETGDIYS